MTTFLTVIFWTGLLIVLYTYAGYGLLISLLSRLRRKPAPETSDGNVLPEVTIVIAAYNEELFIEDKISNTLLLDYPEDRLSIFVVTDGSTDRTPDLVKKFRAVKLFHEAARKGKIHAVNRVMQHVRTPIVVFSDANTTLNPDALQMMVRHFANPEVGGVAGEKTILKDAHTNASGSGEGLYWKYESFLKKKDSEVFSVVGAAGELFAIRTRLYNPPAEETIIEDFVLSLEIAARGHRFVYEPGAVAMETASASVEEEWKRKVRICAGGFQAMTRLKYLLNPFRYGILSFQYISHRVLRWTLAPFFLPVIFIANALLALHDSVFYDLTMLAQMIFYTLAVTGHFLRHRAVPVRGFFAPYYFVMMNIAVYAGLVRYINGQQSVLWEKVQRAHVSAGSYK